VDIFACENNATKLEKLSGIFGDLWIFF